MTAQRTEPKWVLYRHTSSAEIVAAVARALKHFSRSSISAGEKRELLGELRGLGLYGGRGPAAPLDSVTHRINTLEYYMFGHRARVNGRPRFLFGPLGNLFLRHCGDADKAARIFLAMLWGVQFPNRFATPPGFELYPFRLVFGLLRDPRLGGRLHVPEVAHAVVFTRRATGEGYEALVREVLRVRAMGDGELARAFRAREHVLVNAVYEWGYYTSRLLEGMGVLDREAGPAVCRLRHGRSTLRTLDRSSASLRPGLVGLCDRLLRDHPYTAAPPRLDDPRRAREDVLKEVYSYCPQALLDEIGEGGSAEARLLRLPRLIEESAAGGRGWGELEEALEEAFNMFPNVRACRIGGPGNADLECVYTEEGKKFAIDGKSTRNKLRGINAGRLAAHRERIGADYTIVVTPGYAPAAARDIRGARVVILLANTLSEYLYNHIEGGLRLMDYGELDRIISGRLGSDISGRVSDLTFSRFAARGRA